MTKIPEQSPAHKSLLSYQQADEEGIMVLVSRQAIHEVSDELDQAKAACNTFPELVEKVADFLAAEDAVEKEAKRASETGTAWSSAPVVNRIHKLDDLRALLNRIGGEADG